MRWSLGGSQTWVRTLAILAIMSFSLTEPVSIMPGTAVLFSSYLFVIAALVELRFGMVSKTLTWQSHMAQATSDSGLCIYEYPSPNQ